MITLNLEQVPHKKAFFFSFVKSYDEVQQFSTVRI